MERLCNAAADLAAEASRVLSKGASGNLFVPFSCAPLSTQRASFAALVNHRDRVARSQHRRPAEFVIDARASFVNSTMPRTFKFSIYFSARPSVQEGFYDYAGVLNWIEKGHLHLHAVDLLLVPVVMELSYWVLAVVNVRDKLLCSTILF